jgi:acyl dehydratase
VTETVHLFRSKPPSIWASYPFVLLRHRPPVTEVGDPVEIRCEVRQVTLAAKDVAAYATMCKFSRQDAIPVTYPHVLAMPLHLAIFADARFPLRPMGLIHLSNSIESFGDMHAGMPLDIVVAARNYQRSDAGLAFDMATDVTSRGELLWRETCVFLSRWPESVDRKGGRPPRPPKAPRDSAVLAEIDVALSTAWTYARIARDFNPIHLSDRAARFFGLRGAISHGMWSLARSLAQEPAPAIPAGTRIDTQFLTPVQLPARVAIKEWTAEGQVRRALCDMRTGRVHMYAWWSEAAPTPSA